MIKSCSMLKRKPGLTPEEFQQYWKEKHAPLVLKVLPGLRKYVQNHPIKVAGFEFEIDGIAEIWWDDIEAFQNFLRWRQTEEGKVLIEDEDKFINKGEGGIQRFLAMEYLVVER